MDAAQSKLLRLLHILSIQLKSDLKMFYAIEAQIKRHTSNDYLQCKIHLSDLFSVQSLIVQFVVIL